MSRRSLIPARLARVVVAWAGRVSARNPELAWVREEAEWAEDQRQLQHAATAGRAIAAAWPADAYPDIDTHAWQDGDWADLAGGLDPEQIEGARRYDTDWPFQNLDTAAAAAARLIPDPTPTSGPDGSRDVAAARVLLTVLLHAADHSFHDGDQVRAWAGDLTPAGMDAVHTCLHDSGGDIWPALAVLAVAQSLPAPTRTRISAVITTALTTADTTTPDPARSPQP
jgi:hypothetical protein